MKEEKDISDIYEREEYLEEVEKEAGEKEERKQKILNLFSDRNYKPAQFKDLCYIMEVDEANKEEFLNLLNELVAEVKIVKTKNNRYMLTPDHVLRGKYLSTRRGFGFVHVEGEEDDYFIPARDSLNAFHGDSVLIQVSKTQRGPRKEAKIVRIIERETDELIGVFQKCDGYGFVIPNNKKIADDIFIPEKASGGAVTGSIVIVTLLDFGNGKKSPTGKVDEVIGHIDDPATDILQVVKTYNIPVEFPDAVIEQLTQIPETVAEEDKVGRRDFRDLDTVTIDGEDAKDLDDAISLSYDGLYHLGVHIADVSHYVREKSPLDREALRRGTSNYLVDSVIPMIPHQLSNGICSLNHDEDRLTLTCFMDIDDKGRVVSHEICEGLINVNERMNYTDVAAILDGKPDAPVERYKKLIPMFQLMQKLSNIIRDNRKRRGSIDFDVAETKIIVDESGKPVEIKPYDRNCATKIIEDFMLIANETVAEEYYWADIPFEYRVHEAPVQDKMDKLKAFIKNFGIYFKVSRERIHPKEIQKLLNEIEGQPYEALITRMTLRSMQQARYATECIGHFGLADKYYCHFTSPIRRYPDLQIHRIIKENLHGEMNGERRRHYERILPAIAMDNSAKERRADEAERDVVKLKEIEYMSNHVGDVFDGIVSGFTSQYIFVELPSTIEGAVKVADMRDDFYNYYEEKFEMVGESTGRKIVLGDKCRVKCVGCDKVDRVIDFEFIDEDEE